MENLKEKRKRKSNRMNLPSIGFNRRTNPQSPFKGNNNIVKVPHHHHLHEHDIQTECIRERVWEERDLRQRKVERECCFIVRKSRWRRISSEASHPWLRLIREGNRRLSKVRTTVFSWKSKALYRRRGRSLSRALVRKIFDRRELGAPLSVSLHHCRCRCAVVRRKSLRRGESS